MLKPAWYLTDSDWFAQLADAPRLDPDGEAVIGQVAELFGELRDGTYERKERHDTH